MNLQVCVEVCCPVEVTSNLKFFSYNVGVDILASAAAKTAGSVSFIPCPPGDIMTDWSATASMFVQAEPNMDDYNRYMKRFASKNRGSIYSALDGKALRLLLINI